MNGVSRIVASFLLLSLTIVGSILSYTYVVEPIVSYYSSSNRFAVLVFVTRYNSTHSICYVVEGSVEGLVFVNGSWVYGVAERGDLVVVSNELARVSGLS